MLTYLCTGVETWDETIITSSVYHPHDTVCHTYSISILTESMLHMIQSACGKSQSSACDFFQYFHQLKTFPFLSVLFCLCRYFCRAHFSFYMYIHVSFIVFRVYLLQDYIQMDSVYTYIHLDLMYILSKLTHISCYMYFYILCSAF